MTYPKGLSRFFSDELPELTKEQQARLDMVKSVKTPPRDERFPSINQAMHCWNRYNEWVLCVKDTGGDEEGCKPLRYKAMSICPGFWTEQFDENREEGIFNGIGNDFADKKEEAKKHHHH